MPLGDTFKSKMSWSNVLDRFNMRLTGWNAKHLSKGGKMVLIKSTLAGLPTYMMSLLPIPSSIAKLLEKKMNEFLWGTMNGKKKIHHVAWKHLCHPKENGGLGFRRVQDLNKALLIKWHWSFYKAPNNCLWKKIITEKFGVSRSEWTTKNVTGTHGSGRWKYIAQLKRYFFDKVRVKLKNGGKADFWEDKWSGQLALKDKYNMLWEAARKKQGPVKEFVATNQGVCQWKIDLRRRLTDEEIIEVAQFVDEVPAPLLTDEEDELEWFFDGKADSFSVKKQIEEMQKETRQSQSFVPFNVAATKVWVKNTPLKIQFLLWSIAIDRISTLGRLQRLGICMATRCALCQEDVETTEHMFWNCGYSRRIWSMLRGNFDTLQWDSSTTNMAIETWKLNSGSFQGRAIWKVLLHAGIWGIWKERNQRIFREENNSEEKVVDGIKMMVWSWLSTTGAMDGIFFDNFMVNWVSIVNEM